MLLSILDGKIGYVQYDPNNSFYCAALEFDFSGTQVPSAEDIASQCGLPLLKSVCEHFHVAHGSTRKTAALMIHGLMAGANVKTKSGGSKSGGDRDKLVMALMTAGISRGFKTQGKQAGKEVKLDKLNIEELKLTLAAKEAADTAAAKAAVAKDAEVEDEEEDGSAEEEGGEEEVQDDIDEVIYFAHL